MVLFYRIGTKWPTIYPIKIPINRAKVSTLDLTISLLYPFLIATAPTKEPVACMIHTRGSAKTFTIKGPIKGSAPTRAARPANACVNTPNTTVPNTTAFLSIPYRNAMTIMDTIAIQMTTCFQCDLKKLPFSILGHKKKRSCN